MTALLNLWEKDTYIHTPEEVITALTEINRLFINNNIDEAFVLCAKALESYPRNRDVLIRMASLYNAKRDYRNSIIIHLRMMRLFPNGTNLSVHLGIVMKKHGWYRFGINRSLHWMKSVNQSLTDLHHYPSFWMGEALTHKSIRIHADRGYGDLIHFFPVIFDLLEREKAIVHLHARKPIRTLFEGSYQHPNLFYYEDSSELPHTDYFSTYISAFYAFFLKKNQKWAEIDWPIDYLHPSQTYLTKWSHLLTKTNKYKIGLCWAGSAEHEQDDIRSFPLDELIPHLDSFQSHCDFYALGLRQDDKWERINSKNIFHIHDLRKNIADFQDSAAFIKQLDCIISVCTAEAHLAGALGVKTILCLSYDHCWRWPKTEEKSHFYPSIEIIRQEQYGNWKSVFTKIKNKLTLLR
jgi:hypothetical protein